MTKTNKKGIEKTFGRYAVDVNAENKTELYIQSFRRWYIMHGQNYDNKKEAE